MSRQRLAQDDECLFGKIVGGHDIIGLLEIDFVDVPRFDELGEFERLLAFELDPLDLVLVEQHIFAFGIFEALDDIVDIDQPDAGHAFSYLMRLPEGS